MTDEVSKELLSLYFKDNSLVQQHIASYNKFVEKGFQEIINKIGSIQTPLDGYELKLGEVKLDKPKIVEADGSRRDIYPVEARLRNLTYHARVVLDIIPYVDGVEKSSTYRDDSCYIGDLPVMVKSKLCHLHRLSEDELINVYEDPRDPGGYFIINGTERVLVSLEDLASNKIMVSVEAGNAVVAKSFSMRFGFKARCAITRTPEGIMYVAFPSSPKGILLTTTMRALGLSTNEEILSYFNPEPTLRNEIYYNLEVDPTTNTSEAIEFLGKKAAPSQPLDYKLKRAETLLDQYLLPHIGIEPHHRLKKAKYLAKMAEKAIMVGHKKIPPDDKDHYSNKRIKLTGDLIEELVRYSFQYFIKDIAYQASRADVRGRKLSSAQSLVRPDSFSDRIRYSMATGNWIAGQTGVSQLLDRTSYLSTLSHLRRIISPLSRKHPHFEARDLHGTHWGKICPNESPEGPSCSLVKNMALLSNMSVGEDEAIIEELLKRLNLIEECDQNV
ncbi:MAG: DNA-directed RNA polymerase subunit B'' [Candidatus Micrarchaeota archaeon]|nr:DNA-directed RNA polymerase subunit B'' [Candidatus Micrarchaeota archaeon]